MIAFWPVALGASAYVGIGAIILAALTAAKRADERAEWEAERRLAALRTDPEAVDAAIARILDEAA